jgi:hypothetical protein
VSPSPAGSNDNKNTVLLYDRSDENRTLEEGGGGDGTQMFPCGAQEGQKRVEYEFDLVADQTRFHKSRPVIKMYCI